MGRLLTVTKDGTLVEEYRYGANGARSYEMNLLRGISGRSYEYSSEDQVLTTGDLSYRYDVDGFLAIKTISGTTTTYEYATRGELMKVTLPDGNVVEYVNDPLGRRIAKKVNGTITEKYLWQGLTRLLAIFDSSDNILMRFIYAGNRMPVAMESGGATYYLAYDQVGSLRLVTDATGNVIKTLDYDSFGNIIQDTNPTFDMPFAFAGGFIDVDTGLVRFGFREYSPEIGRWTAKDPILFSGGIDLYGYCLNDPITLTDPMGLLGFGIQFSESTEAGVFAAGAGQTGSVGAGVFSNGLSDINVGGFRSWGGYAGGPLGSGYGPSYPPSGSTYSDKNFVAGAYAGGGVNLFFTNAKNACQLEGPFRTYSFNVGWKLRALSLQLSVGSDGTWLFSYGGPIGSLPTGGGFGFSVSGYNTNTWVTK
jgi:RHS repeat-associated protein